MDIATASLEELKAHQDTITKRIQELEGEILQKIEAQAAQYGFTIVPSGLINMKPPKYRNPDNPEETYGGKGKRPKWLQAKLDAGHSLEEFAAN